MIKMIVPNEKKKKYLYHEVSKLGNTLDNLDTY